MRHRILLSLTAGVTFFAATTVQAVTFSGRAGTDFPGGACITDPSIDPGGQDVQFVVAGAIRTSGFDVTKLCILYDAASDTVQVGTLTHNNAANTDIITGDADGNGDPATVSSDLDGSGIQDIANFGPKEFFSLLLDFDFTVNNGFSIVAGKHSDASFADYNVFVAASANLDNTATSAMYGAVEGAAIGSAPFASPSSSALHLEFLLAHFKSIPGLTLDWTDPNDTIGLYFTMGSYSDGAIGEELFPSKLSPRIFYRFYPLTVAHLLQIDADGDGTIDDLDLDDDNDGIPDLIELGLKGCDLDGDGVLSVSQDLNSNGIFGAGEEGEILKCTGGGFAPGGKDIVRKTAFPGGKYPDYDNDGTPNYLDTDSDNDGVPDKDEDKNGNGVVDPTETSPLNPDTDGDGISDFDELQKFKIDTDGDGLSDGEEVEIYKTDPLKPDTDADDLKDGDEVKLYGTDPLKPDTDGGGARDGLEVQRGTNPLDPSDDQKALVDPNNPFEGPQTTVGPGEVDAGTLDPDLAGYSTKEVQVSGSGLTSCSLRPNAPLAREAWLSLLLVLGGLLAFRKIRYLLFLFILLASIPVHALDAQRQRLPMNGYGGLFQDNPQMLGQFNWNVQVGLDYTKKPLSVSLINSGATVDNVVDYFLTQDTSIAFGVTDWLDVAVAFQSNIPSRVEPFGSTTATTQADFGDILISTKFLLMDAVEQKYGIGLALVPFVTLPAGNEGRYLGANSLTGGFKLVGERYFGRTNVYMTLGADFFERETFLNMVAANEFFFGFGAQHPLSTQHDLLILGEVDGSTTFRKFMHEQVSSPVEMNGGLRKYWFNRHFATTVSAGAGLDSGYGAPQVRVMGVLSWFSSGVKDRDEDRVLDPGDYCPTQIAFNQPHSGAEGEAPAALPMEGATRAPIINPRPGCPDPKVIVKIVGDRILILRPINFETGSATITADSTTVVNQIATLLRNSPELKKILVEGHTDNVGGAAYNLNLSEARAKAVVAALVSLGIEANRLESRGWGLGKPLTTNASESGRAKNRRVEFHIIEFAKP